MSNKISKQQRPNLTTELNPALYSHIITDISNIVMLWFVEVELIKYLGQPF